MINILILNDNWQKRGAGAWTSLCQKCRIRPPHWLRASHPFGHVHPNWTVCGLRRNIHTTIIQVHLHGGRVPGKSMACKLGWVAQPHHKEINVILERRCWCVSRTPGNTDRADGVTVFPISSLSIPDIVLDIFFPFFLLEYFFFQ